MCLILPLSTGACNKQNYGGLGSDSAKLNLKALLHTTLSLSMPTSLPLRLDNGVAAHFGCCKDFAITSFGDILDIPVHDNAMLGLD